MPIHFQCRLLRLRIDYFTTRRQRSSIARSRDFQLMFGHQSGFCRRQRSQQIYTSTAMRYESKGIACGCAAWPEYTWSQEKFCSPRVGGVPEDAGRRVTVTNHCRRQAHSNDASCIANTLISAARVLRGKKKARRVQRPLHTRSNAYNLNVHITCCQRPIALRPSRLQRRSTQELLHAALAERIFPSPKFSATTYRTSTS